MLEIILGILIGIGASWSFLFIHSHKNKASKEERLEIFLMAIAKTVNERLKQLLRKTIIELLATKAEGINFINLTPWNNNIGMTEEEWNIVMFGADIDKK